MKRRNVESGGKLRRPLKRNKITEGMCSSTTVLYIKFLVLWAVVIAADFMFMFRFEFLWPFWLLLRSVHDSFKYKGLAFSVLFVCIAITSDLVCLFFIPVHWLLFAASTYVWVQYVWHTDKGICLPTIILWMLFVYWEAGIRWKESRHMPHLDLCRPFAAHCIGYPVVTLGFGIKSYIGYRMRQRKQREVAKENEFYMQLLQQALPQENSLIDENQLLDKSLTCNNGVLLNSSANNSNNQSLGNSSINAVITTVSTNHHHSNSSATSSLNNIAASISNSSTVSSFISALTTVSLSSLTSCSSAACSVPSTTASTSPSTTLTKTLAASSNVVANISSIFSSNSNQQSSVRHTEEQTILQKDTQTNDLPTTANGLPATNDLKNGVLSNGHVTTSNNKNSRRSLDKENKHKQNVEHVNSEHKDLKSNHNMGNGGSNLKQNILHSSLHDNSLEHKTTEWREKDLTTLHTSPVQGNKERNTSSSSKKQNSSAASSSSIYNAVDGNDVPVVAEVSETVERSKGKRFRAKKDHTSSNKQQDTANTSNSNNVQNSDASSVSSLASSSSSSTNSSTFANVATSISNGIAASTGAASSGLTNLTSKVISKICETCLKLEADVKKFKSEISHMKQIENELRQKVENTINLKFSLQTKQKECDDLERRIHELTTARNADMMQLQATERRLTEERRQKQSVDAQLSNEKKARKLAEEKASRPECSLQCKQRKLRMDDEIRQLRHELKQAEEAKQLAQEHGHKWEQELRMFEAEVRTRDSAKPRTEMLMNALAAMQDKNCTLEKNLSAETRVKLDLFSALGDAKRQLEISENRRISKEDEVLDLKAKIAQLLAVMPTDTLCLQQHCSGTGTSNLMRMNDTPPLQGVPASPILSNMVVPQAIVNPVSVGSRNSDYRQHNHNHNHNNNNNNNSNNNNNTPDYGVSNHHGHSLNQHSHGQQLVTGLDPNACIYTPQNGANSVSPNGMGANPEN